MEAHLESGLLSSHQQDLPQQESWPKTTPSLLLSLTPRPICFPLLFTDGKNGGTESEWILPKILSRRGGGMRGRQRDVIIWKGHSICLRVFRQNPLLQPATRVQTAPSLHPPSSSSAHTPHVNTTRRFLQSLREDQKVRAAKPCDTSFL